MAAIEVVKVCHQDHEAYISFARLHLRFFQKFRPYSLPATILPDTKIDDEAYPDDFCADPDHSIIQGHVSDDVAPGVHDDTKVRLLLDIGSAIEEAGERLIEQGAKLILHCSWKRRLSEGLDHYRSAF